MSEANTTLDLNFGATTTNKKFGFKRVPITAKGGGPLILQTKNCFSFGPTAGKFGEHRLPLVLKLGNGHEEFLSQLRSVKSLGEKHLVDIGIPDESGERNILKCLWEDGEDPILYAKIDDDTEIYRGSDADTISHTECYGNCNANVAVRVRGIHISNSTVSLQITAHEVLILSKKASRVRIFSA